MNEDDKETRAQVEAIYAHLIGLRHQMETTRDEYEQEISDYAKFTQLAKSIMVEGANGADEYKTLSHIGQGCHVQAVIPQASKSVHVHIGLGFFTEVSLKDALEISSKRINILRGKVILTEGTIVNLEADLAAVLAENGADTIDEYRKG